MPTISFLPSEVSFGEHQSSMTVNAHSNGHSKSRHSSSLESQNLSYNLRQSPSVEVSANDGCYNDGRSINSMDEILCKKHDSGSTIMDKKLVVILVTAGSLALFFMLIVGAILPDDGEFGAKGGVTTTNENNNVNHDNYRIVPLPPEDIDRLCDDAFIASPHGYAICRQACKLSECCMINSEVEGSCLCGDNRKVCALYQKSCEKVYQDDLNKKGNTNVTVPIKNVTVHVDKASLENICSNNNLSTDEGKIKCYDACKPAMCCFQTNNSSSSCNTTDTKVWCSMFSTCSKISFELVRQNLRKRKNGDLNITSEIKSLTSNASNTSMLSSIIDHVNSTKQDAGGR